jgi:hypothetical protein
VHPLRQMAVPSAPKCAFFSGNSTLSANCHWRAEGVTGTLCLFPEGY